MELGGKVTIVCEKTRYSADIEFKLKVLNFFFVYSNLMFYFFCSHLLVVKSLQIILKEKFDLKKMLYIHFLVIGMMK
jgi:hypothetical protein